MRTFLSSFLTRWDRFSASLLRLSPDRAFPWSVVPLLLVTALLASGCESGNSGPDAGAAAPSTDPAIRVETYQLEPQSFENVIEVTGTVEAIHDATLSAQVSGTIIYIADRGVRVREGDPVAQVDSVEAHAALVQARAQYELAQDRYNRQQPLYRDSIISALEFQQVRSELTQAKSALAQARKRLDNTTLEAPFSGTVEKRFVELGEQISPGQNVARVVDVRPARITAGVPERYVGEVEKGTTVEVRFSASSVSSRTGRVSFVGSAIDPESRTFPIEITLPNRERTIKPEMSVQLRVTGKTFENVISIPRTAVLRDETGPYVYVAEQTDSTVVAQSRDVVLGAQTGARVVADSGLAAGDRLIIAGQNNVAPGTPVTMAQQYDRLPTAGTPYEGDTSQPAPPTN